MFYIDTLNFLIKIGAYSELYFHYKFVLKMLHTYISYVLVRMTFSSIDDTSYDEMHSRNSLV